MEKVLVTGATGYLGACIVEELQLSVYQAITLDRRLDEIGPGTLDVSFVIHCAGALRHRSNEYLTSNVEGTQQLLVGLKRPTPIIYISSRSVYALEQQWATERSPINPWDSYGQSKLEAEQFIQASSYPFIILRSTGLWGAGIQNIGRIFPSLAAKRLIQQQPVTLYLPDRLHDYLYVKDLARWTVQLLCPGKHWNQIFNVSGPPRFLHQLIEGIQREIIAQGFPAGRLCYQEGPLPSTALTLTKKLFDYFPSLSLTEDAIVAKELIQSLGN